LRPVRLLKILFGVAAVVDHSGVDLVSGRLSGKVISPPRQIAKDSDLAGAVGNFGRSRGSVFDIPRARVPIVSLVQAQAVLPVGLRLNIGSTPISARL